MGLCGLMSVPVLAAGLDDTSGFTAYAGRWEMNNGPSLILIGLASWKSEWVGGSLSPRLIFSGMACAITLMVVAWSTNRPVANGQDLVGRVLAVAACVFLVSPTQFPWYALWFLPFLAIRPMAALLIYGITLPLYYLRFLFVDMGWTHWFDWGVVWLEHGPVMVLLGAAWWLDRRSPTQSEPPSLGGVATIAAGARP
jgi:hypothetical protein